MSLTPGARVGSYEVLSLLGTGGMGEVYRARDTRLNRDVAIKVLRGDTAIDQDRLQRFIREAQTLAALNNPHIAQIYGLEDPSSGSGQAHSTGSGQALVMELVEGEDLSARLAREAIPIDEAIAIAKQIAEALESAHDAGIVHRDLKPANIKVRRDGTVKVLVLEVGKSLDGGGGAGGAGRAGEDLLNSPTFTSPAATHAGVILGTAAYMSPEQARGKQVDKRADIWAFGVVLYEMLSGERAFPGDTVTDVLAAVVTREPDWTALPAATPARVRELLTRCLEKDQQVRLRDIGEARIALNHPHAYAKSPATASTGAASLRQRILIASLAALVLLAAVGAWLLKPVPSAPLRKLEISLPGDGTSFTLSRDGRSVAFAARGHIWVRDLSTLQSRDLGAATLAQRSGIVWSPDSSALGYNTADGKFITVAARGGAPLVVCNIPETRQLMGAEWRHDGSIVLAVWRGSLYEVPASGGEPRVIVTIDPAKEIDFHEPVALPDGRVIVARHLAPAAGSEPADYSLEIIDGSRRETILANSTFQPSAYLDEGYLLTTRFDANQGVWAFRYDGRGPLRIENAVPIAPGGSFLSVGHDGTLLYSLPPEGPQPRELVWVDRTGRVTGQVGTATDLSGPMLSPDGTRVAFSARVDNTLDIWVRDVRSGAETRVSFEADDEVQPAWFPSGRRLAYRLLPGGVFNSQIMARDLGDAERHDLISALGIAVSRDGKYAAFYVDDRGRNRLRYATMGPDSVISAGTPLFKTTPEPDAGVPAFSPDGRFIAYVDRQPGGNAEIFVTRFPSGDGRWQISSGGGRGPVWARNGELFFLAGATTGAKQMMAVRIEERDTVHPSVPLKLFDIGEELDVNYLMPNFDVSADGKQLLMVRRARSGAAARWVLVQNWMAEFQVR